MFTVRPSVGNLGAAVKLIATLIEQSAWIFSFADEAEEEGIAQDEEEAQQGETSEPPGCEAEIFHEAQTSIYETAQEPSREGDRPGDSSPYTLGAISKTGAMLLTA